MIIIYNNIAEDIIDSIEKANISNRTIKEIHLTESEARELNRITGYTYDVLKVGHIFKFSGVTIRVSSK